MNTTLKPRKLTIRSYQVGFGDCFLLSFDYGSAEKHILMDFGSTRLPEGVSESRLLDVAKDIAKRTKGKLHGVVVTHRHKDHISGFATQNGAGSGDVIKKLKPDIVIQPWTEDPNLAPNATGPAAQKGEHLHVAGLSTMHQVAELVFGLSNTNGFPKALRDQLSFLGENNISNRSAVDNLMTMGKNVYVHCGFPLKLEKILPGVRAHVLGPPTVKQSDTIKKQRRTDKDEFWHFQAKALRAFASKNVNGDKPKILFSEHIESKGPKFPIGARWLIYHARQIRGDRLLQIVRMLDKAMNNTSVILVLEIGNKKLLFPGDAQIENWAFALKDEKFRDLLADVNLYKVGHHGSLNATPKSLWRLFKNRSSQISSKRLLTLMSTLECVHGHKDKDTEVPRRTLVTALKRDSTLLSTQEIEDPDFFRDTVMNF